MSMLLFTFPFPRNILLAFFEVPLPQSLSSIILFLITFFNELSKISQNINKYKTEFSLLQQQNYVFIKIIIIEKKRRLEVQTLIKIFFSIMSYNSKKLLTINRQILI